VLIVSARDRSGIDQLADALDAHLRSFTPEGLAARRLAGAVHSTLSLLLRRFGEHGLEQLGGRDRVSQRALESLRSGRPPLGVVSELSQTFLGERRS
jgi:hypothetical protein